MFWMKACPRCKGDLFLDQDAINRDVVCLQCGYRRGSNRLDLHETVIDSEERPQAYERLLEVEQ
ncbi:MAG TPA: hypothetical protein G4O07_01350 [Dehalococcoidia bacterium]|nr:hypothetical protein [Dehalococcoidia bacterium]